MTIPATVIETEPGARAGELHGAMRPELGAEAAQWVAGPPKLVLAPDEPGTANITPGIQMVKRALIALDSSTQARTATTASTVREYAEAMRDGKTFPPVELIYDAVNDAYWVCDGFHRIAAGDDVHEGNRDYEIEAKVTLGAHRDAVLLAVQANHTHGLPRTNKDKRRAVTLLLQDEEWRQRSDRAIAVHAGVTHPLVADLRRELFPEGVQQVRRFKNKYGGESVMHVASKAAPTLATPGADADVGVIGGDAGTPSVEEASTERTASTEEPAERAAKRKRSPTVSTKNNGSSPTVPMARGPAPAAAVPPVDTKLADARKAARIVQDFAPLLLQAANVMTGAAREEFLTHYEVIFSTAMRVLALPMTLEPEPKHSRKRAQSRRV